MNYLKCFFKPLDININRNEDLFKLVVSNHGIVAHPFPNEIFVLTFMYPSLFYEHSIHKGLYHFHNRRFDAKVCIH